LWFKSEASALKLKLSIGCYSRETKTVETPRLDREKEGPGGREHDAILEMHSMDVNESIGEDAAISKTYAC
jgi:hypothetical protein